MWSGLGELNLLRTQYHTQSLSHTVTLMRTHEHTHARTITDTETHCPLIQAGKRSQSHTVMPVITVSEQRHGHIGYIHHLSCSVTPTPYHTSLRSISHRHTCTGSATSYNWSGWFCVLDHTIAGTVCLPHGRSYPVKCAGSENHHRYAAIQSVFLLTDCHAVSHRPSCGVVHASQDTQ